MPAVGPQQPDSPACLPCCLPSRLPRDCPVGCHHPHCGLSVCDPHRPHVSQLPKRFWNSDLLTAYRPRWGGPPASRVAAKRQLSVTYDPGSTLGLWLGCLSDGGRWKAWLVLIEVYIPLLNSHLKIAVFVAKQKQKSVESWAILYVSRSPGCVRLGFKKKKKILLRCFIFTRIPVLGRNANTLTHTDPLECTLFLFPTLATCEVGLSVGRADSSVHFCGLWWAWTSLSSREATSSHLEGGAEGSKDGHALLGKMGVARRFLWIKEFRKPWENTPYLQRSLV